MMKNYFLMLLLLRSLAFSGEYLIKVNFSKARLTLYEGGEKFKEFPVALPKPEHTPKKFPIEGKILKVEKDPYWYPTEAIKDYYFQTKGIQLPHVVPPNHPLNAMGKAKIIIDFQGKIKEPIRIHGTNDPSSIGKRVSRGCIRLRNEDIVTLIQILALGEKTQETKVIFEQ